MEKLGPAAPEVAEKSPREKIGESLWGFPLVGILSYIKESGLDNDLATSGVEIVEGNPYGKPKIQNGNLGTLYAYGLLEEEAGSYKWASKSSHDELLNSAVQIKTSINDGQLQEATYLSGGILKQAAALPWIRAIQEQALAPTDYHESLLKLGLIGDDGELSRLGQKLMAGPVIPGFAQLINSYTPTIIHLSEVADDPSAAGFNGPYGREQATNAAASNQLISNVVERLRPQIQSWGNRLLDQGSGGGYFAHAMGMESVLFDMSEIANKKAEQLFKDNGSKNLLAGTITGSITNQEDLKAARRLNPDVVTINYIPHDIVGQAPDYESGLAQIDQFLGHYGEIFGDTPLFISESWDVSWADLKTGGKPYITLYTWLHAISPQKLLDKNILLKMLDERGFSVQTAAVNGTLEIDGIKKPINETLLVRKAR